MAVRIAADRLREAWLKERRDGWLGYGGAPEGKAACSELYSAAFCSARCPMGHVQYGKPRRACVSCADSPAVSGGISQPTVPLEHWDVRGVSRRSRNTLSPHQSVAQCVRNLPKFRGKAENALADEVLHWVSREGSHSGKGPGIRWSASWKMAPGSTRLSRSCGRSESVARTSPLF